jgi:sugar phosphate permease
MTILVIGWSLMTGLTALVGDVPLGVNGQLVVLLVMRFVFGLFQAGGFPVWARVVNDWMPATERGFAHGTVWMFSRLGGFIAPILFGRLYIYYGNWQTPLWILGGIGLVWCAFFWPWFRNRPSEKPTVNAAERELIDRGRNVAAPAGPVPWGAMASSLNIWALSLMYGCVGFTGNFITNMLAVYLKKYRGLSDFVTDWVTAMPLLMGLFGCLVGGFLSDRLTRRMGRKWGRRIVPAIGLCCAGRCDFLVPHAKGVWLLASLFAASFFCNDLMMGPAWASCADVGERYSGTVSGIMNMIGQFFGAVGMILAGVLLQRGYAETMFTVFGCSYVLAGLCWLAVDVTRPPIAVNDPSVGAPPNPSTD